jgi:hypothetical protein
MNNGQQRRTTEREVAKQAPFRRWSTSVSAIQESICSVIPVQAEGTIQESIPNFFEEEVVSNMDASVGRRRRLGSPRIYSLGER